MHHLEKVSCLWIDEYSDLCVEHNLLQINPFTVLSHCLLPPLMSPKDSKCDLVGWLIDGLID